MIAINRKFDYFVKIKIRIIIVFFLSISSTILVFANSKQTWKLHSAGIKSETYKGYLGLSHESKINIWQCNK